MIRLLVNLIPNISEIRLQDRAVSYIEKGVQVPSSYLSAGHKSILAMIGDMLIRLFDAHPNEVTDPSELSGVVLIDELECHLHPSWQVELPNRLSKVFPKVQFIASIHSPLPILGAPKNTFFLKVTREKGFGTRVEKIEIDVTRLLPNTLLTSPLFGMKSIANRNLKDIHDVKTHNHFKYVRVSEAVDKKLAEFENRHVIPDALLEEEPAENT